MKIKADKTGIEAITTLCDIAVRTGGLQNVNPIYEIIHCMEPLEAPDASEEDK